MKYLNFALFLVIAGACKISFGSAQLSQDEFLVAGPQAQLQESLRKPLAQKIKEIGLGKESGEIVNVTLECVAKTLKCKPILISKTKPLPK